MRWATEVFAHIGRFFLAVYDPNSRSDRRTFLREVASLALVAFADQLEHARLAIIGQFGFQTLRAVAHLVAQVGFSHGRNVARGLVEEVHPRPLDAQVEKFAHIAHRDVVHSRTPFIDVGGTTVPRGRLVPGSSSQLSTPTLDKMRQRSR